MSMAPISAGIVLNNSRNLCYANAVILAMQWMGQASGITSDSAFGALSAAFAGLEQNKPTSLLQMRQWKQMFEHWQHHGLQQDCAKFLHRLLEFAKPVAYYGLWQSRLTLTYGGQPRLHIQDQGQTFCPVAMEL